MIKNAIKVIQPVLFVTGFWRKLILDKINGTPKNNIIPYNELSQYGSSSLRRNININTNEMPLATLSHFFNSTKPPYC
jgi:hypothetical protein